MPDAIKSPPKLRFTSLEDLEKAAEVDKKKPQSTDVKLLEKALPKLDVLLKDARVKGDDETTYIVASRYFDVIRTIHRAKNKNDTTWHGKYTNPKEALELLERLKESLASRYKANGFGSSVERGKSPVQPNGHTVYQSNNGVVSDKKQKDLSAKDMKEQTEITATELNQLLKANDNSVLLFDLRNEDEFEDSHIICKNIVNLPQDKTEGALTATIIENMIDTPFKAAWRTRQVFDKVVIMDGGNTRLSESSAVKNLIAVLVEFSSEPIKSRPLLLTGGFYGFNTSFPHLTSNPHYRAPRQENTKFRNITNIRFPTMKLFSDVHGDYPPTVSPKPFRPNAQRNDRTTDDFLPNKEGPVYIKDILADVLPKIQRPSNARRSPTPDPAAPRRTEVITEIPAVNRGLKPKQSNTSIPSDTSLSSNKSDNGYDASMSSNNSNNGYDEVLNSPFVNQARGSGEHLGDFSSYEDGRSQTLPTAKRSVSTVPSVSRNSKPDPSQSNPRNIPSSREDGSSRPPSVDKLVNDLANADVRNVDARSSTLPSGAKLSRIAKDDFFDSSSSKVRNIPIIMENSPDTGARPSPQPPQPQRALKPLDTNRMVDFTLPEYPSSSQWQPCSEKPTEPGRMGLANLGNTCYMSGVLQCLSHTQLIRSFYLRNAQGEKRYRQSVNPNNSRGTKGLISVYMDLLMELLWSGRYRWISPHFMKDALTHYKRDDFYGREQQDAFSALSAILGLLHQDTNQAKMVGASSQERRLALAEMEDSDKQSITVLVNDAQKKHKLITDSWIDRLLMFLKENVVQCQNKNCGYESRTFTCDQMLNLWFPPVQDGYHIPDRSELSNLLNAEMCPSEPIEYKCKNCQRTGNAVQRHYFHSDPEILIVQFKRFGDSSSAYDDYRFHKDTRFVNFSHSLSLAKFYRNPTGRKSEYKLYAVLDHFGTLSSGHYIANCLHSETGKWLKFDDQTVTELSGSAPKDLISQHAYILFYERLS